MIVAMYLTDALERGYHFTGTYLRRDIRMASGVQTWIVPFEVGDWDCGE